MMFSIYGVMLTVYGLLSNKAEYDRSLGININFIWGLALLAFGVFMLVLAWRGKQAAALEAAKPVAKATAAKR